MPIAQLSDVALRYEIVGSGEPVLLVAGLGGSAGYWAPNVDAFAARHQVVLHDHRGTGGSTRSEMDYSVELLADDLLRLMDHLKIDRAHLVGHSTGGAMGIVLGASAPERIASLVLYATWAELDAQMEQCLSMRRRILSAMGEAEYHRATPLFLYPPTYVRDHKADLEREIAAAVAATPSRSIMDARAKGIMAFDGLGYLDDISCPTLVLVAQDDILTPPYSSELIAARIAGAQFVEVPRGGHAFSRVEPAAFNSLTLDFLAAHPIGTHSHV
ncbi:alpha/beta fold hydrolase [Rhodopseudomonas sp. B29]|uniref:alpha/beta fold hydrolase n=1 Tax=Rhodopseudomonas sp. B29 TaxID=95607 RepID=UPI00034BD89C|nr:alpha/beta fold hydrolase [Rhodopseudomonas sp. B29]